jgi:uncharacterized protein YkwD
MAAGIVALLSAVPCTAGAVALTPEEQALATRLVGDRGQRRSSRQMTLDPILTAVARARAADMGKRRYFAHVNPDGYGPNYLARAAGYGLPDSWSGGRSANYIESIGAGYPTPEAAWEGWMHSPAHRTHLLASSAFYRDQTSFGIGSYSDPASPYRRYWVIITAPPSSSGTFVSRRLAEPARVAVTIPIRNHAMTDALNASESAPRPKVIRRPAAKKPRNWSSPVRVPRPSATRLFGAE